MIYEIRHYTLHNGMFDDMVLRFGKVNLPLFEKYGITLERAWSHPDDPNKFSFLMSFPDAASRQRSWERYHEDEMFLAGRESQKAIIQNIEWHVLDEMDVG